MTAPHVPECLFVAGPNGGGKSTVYARLLETGMFPVGRLHINTDDIRRNIEQQYGYASDIDAARISIDMVRNAIAERRDFVFETTLSSNHSVRSIEVAGKSGFRIGLIFVVLQTAELHIARIRTRVAQGGHAIPDADVLRRYRTSLTNFARMFGHIDEGLVVDNSPPDSPRQLIKIDSGRLSRLEDFDSNFKFDADLWEYLADNEPPW